MTSVVQPYTYQQQVQDIKDFQKSLVQDMSTFIPASPKPYMGQTFYTILFSLDDPKNNRYIDMLQFQARALHKTKMLREDDRYFIVADKESVEVLKAAVWLPKQTRIMVVPKPKSLYEGMRLKYLAPYFMSPPLHVNEVAIYLDVDILPIKKTEFISLPPDTIAVLPEGPKEKPDYCGDTPLALPAGVSAGFFAFRFGGKVHAFFQELLKILEKGRSDFYTLDQPHFNHLLARIAFKGFLQPELMSFNGHGDLKKASLVNFAGEPGDGPFHLRKLQRFFVEYFS